jgi:lytic murein transglycosylase
MEARYGVPKQYLTAIWGLETSYGAIMGGFNVFEALATLAFEGRRMRFGREQLLAALRIVEEGHKDPERMTGSWAGAMGHTQFIPTTFLQYAVDGDGDGRRDMWDSLEDVFASTASYLAEADWRKGERWGREVLLPPGFDHAFTGMDKARPLTEWRERGIRMTSGALIPAVDDMEGAIILPAGADGPAFMVYPNFRSIMRYNNSTAYALAIGHLADRIVGAGGIEGDWPRDDRPLTRSEREEMQRLLNELGHDAGPVDGILGAQTRAAVRAFQKGADLPPDGYASARLLERLRAAASG